jgi:predicted PurR-regulated permease PerM
VSKLADFEKTKDLAPPAGADPLSAMPSSDAMNGDQHPPDGSTFWSWMRQTARLWGFLAFVLIILITFRSVITPFALGALVAYLLAPLLRFFGQLHLGTFKPPRFIWLILLYTVLLGLLVLFVTSFVPRVSKDFKRILQETPAFWAKVNEVWVPALASYLQKNFGEISAAPASRKPLATPPPTPRLRLKPLPGGEVEVDAQGFALEVVHQSQGTWLIRTPPPSRIDPVGEHRFTDAFQRYINEFVVSSERRINQLFLLGQALIFGILKAITSFILVFMISAFLLVDTEKIHRAMRNLMPRRYFADFDIVIRLIDKGLAGAIRGQLLICVINAILTWVGLIFIGVKYPLLMAILAGVMSLIPIFGSILSSIPIIMVAMVSTPEGVDVFKGLLILAWIIGIHLLEANFLNPKIIGTAARIHPVIVVFAVVAGEHTYGPVGALLGVPLVSAIQAIFIYLRSRVRHEPQEVALPAAKERG